MRRHTLVLEKKLFWTTFQLEHSPEPLSAEPVSVEGRI